MKVCATAFCLLLAASVAAAEVHKGDAGTVYVPDGLAEDAVVPVLVVEGGLADGAARLWPLLNSRLELIIVEAAAVRLEEKSPNPQRRVEDAIENALAFAESKRSIASCPWAILGFSAAAHATATMVLRADGRYQGLLLVNGNTQASELPRDPARDNELLVAILHGTRDPVFPIERAKKLQDGAFNVHEQWFVPIDTADHMAPLGEAGAEHLVKFLKHLGEKPVTERADRGSERRKTVETAAADGLKLTADIYSTGRKSDPVILLFHQARSSRGEYAKIAPVLVRKGYSCIALDQRSGGEWEGVANETAKRAKEAGKGRSYMDAKPDLERAIAWARELGFSGKLAIWGSSYSAALVFLVGAESDDVSAVVAFSPGDYLKPRGAVFEGAGKLAKPVLIVCPPNEEAGARKVFDAVKGEEKVFFVQPGGVHGSSTIYRTETGEQAGAKVLGFLGKHLR